MCGIIGFIGVENSKDIILSGLKKLEYRGYDSAGIALVNNSWIHVFKDKGRIANLESIIDPDIDGNIGMGHTRWATHGKPNKINSHPHQSQSKRFTVIHNGIIENEEELKIKYLQGVNFISDTDTEVIAQLFEKFLEKEDDIQILVRDVLSKIIGSYALVIIDEKNPDMIIAAKNKSPLLIGKGQGFNMVGSDAMAMIHKTNLFYELHDNEYAIITRSKVDIYSIYGVKQKRETFYSEIDESDIDRGMYDHYMLKEINEQPYVIRRLIENYFDSDHNIIIGNKIAKSFRECDRIYIIACGTSYHAGMVGKHYFEQITGKPAEIHISSEFVYNMPLISEKPLFIFISQSGETADSRAALLKIKKYGYPNIAITNVKGSTLYRETDMQLLLYAGPEIAVASTKAYTAQICLLFILACGIVDCNINAYKELTVAANVVESLCDIDANIIYKEVSKQYLANSNDCFYIGRGLDYFTCLEGALKLKEISYIHTEGFAAGELKHGTIALIEDGTPLIAIITQENTNLNTRSNIKEVKARGAEVIVISLKSLSSDNDQIVIHDVHGLLAPLVSVIPTQYLAYYAALEKGCDVDKPRNLAKSVTVE